MSPQLLGLHCRCTFLSLSNHLVLYMGTCPSDNVDQYPAFSSNGWNGPLTGWTVAGSCALVVRVQ